MSVLALIVLCLVLAAAIYTLAARQEDLRVAVWCVVIFDVVLLLAMKGIL